MKYTYTIIIPHKNSPKLLQRCLDSIPHRDDSHVIVVDDNSDSDLVDFEKFPGLERNDVDVIFTKEGKGAGYARNVGLAHTESEKVIFADADDYFNYCLSEILNEYKEDNTDIVFFNRLNVDSEYYTYSSKRDWYGWLFRKYDENPQEGEKSFKYQNDGPVCKIIRKSLIDKYDIRFEETTNQNDVRFSYLSGYYAKSIKVDKRAIYTVTYSPTSIMFTWNPEKIKTRMGVYSRKVVFLKEHHITNGINCVEKLIIKIRKENPELYEDCLNIISANGLDSNYYRTYTDKWLSEEEKRKNKDKRITAIKNFLHPLKRFIC